MARKNNIFKSVPTQKVNRNLFDLSHEVKMSGKFGYLYPILCMEVLPGDTVRDTMNVFARFAPMLAPIMHRIDVSTHFFKVPNRIITDHWEDFITGGQDGLQAPILPYIQPNNITGTLMGKGTLWDYLGLPIKDNPGVAPPGGWSTQQISALPFRAIGKVWNDYYRDPNLTTEIDLGVETQGNVSVAMEAAGLLSLETFRRGFEKDYFTSALPWAQRGAQVLMPLAGTATVSYDPVSSVYTAAGATPGAFDLETLGATTDLYVGHPSAGQTTGRIENIDEVTIDGATTTINDFRRAIAIQRWLENNARGGARYVEQIMGHFNVQVPDYRLQRAEYLGGGKQPVQISEVLTTAEGAGDHPDVGDMAGHGISVGRTNTFTYRCQEHGFIVGFMSVTMRTAYSQGINKMWTRTDKYEYAWPELAHLGEQEIESKELFYSFDEADATDNDSLFGYIPRYSEYKFMNDRIAGDFRDNLGFWHLGRKLLSRPSLDENFTTIYEDGDALEESFRRIFTVQDGTDYLWFQLYHKLTAKRPLPYFGVPTI